MFVSKEDIVNKDANDFNYEIESDINYFEGDVFYAKGLIPKDYHIQLMIIRYFSDLIFLTFHLINL